MFEAVVPELGQQLRWLKVELVAVVGVQALVLEPQVVHQVDLHSLPYSYRLTLGCTSKTHRPRRPYR